MDRIDRLQHVYTMGYYKAMKINLTIAIVNNIDESQNISKIHWTQQYIYIKLRLYKIKYLQN